MNFKGKSDDYNFLSLEPYQVLRVPIRNFPYKIRINSYSYETSLKYLHTVT